jgi:ABC-type molybdate transport system, periplasmic component
VKIGALAATAKVAILFLLAQCFAAQAAEIKVFVADIMDHVVADLGPKFERSSGHKLVVKSGLAVAGIKEIQAGESVDLMILPAGLIKNPTYQTLYAPGTATNIARVGQGVAVRAGAPKPDISSAEKFKEALLKAKSVTFVPQGLSGVHTLKVFETLGISDQMKAKTKGTLPADVPTKVAKGDAELALFLTNFLIGAPGVDFVGPYPAEFQQYIVFSGVVSANAKEAEPAKALVKFLADPANAGVIKAKGMEPAAP